MSGYKSYTLPTRFLIHLGHWLSGWCDIISGLSSVLTFAQYRVWLDMRFRGWWMINVEIPRMRVERARKDNHG